MKRRMSTFWLMIFLMLCFVQTSFAQSSALKIGYVNLTVIFDKYQKTVDYDKVLEQRSTDYKKQRNDLVAKIQEAERRITLLKEEERMKVAQQIEKDKQALMDFDQKKQTELRKDRDDKIREILLEIESVVKAYAQREKYDIILNDRVLIYGAESFDLTQRILDSLNAAAPKK
ncbi:MAG TPA: OmpH family outer membrane protein [Candidatus Omnitrophota bacterium]|nr:OmpH family outer membrane protein [Candidatus Omnitrophota bacterium]HQL41968.1 OmpH family outer membrane protein [Candidatus Omnitrophota bacterium]